MVKGGGDEVRVADAFEPLDEAETRKPARASLVPVSSVSGRALVVIIAIMTFLASLTIGAVDLVRSAAADWTSNVIREVTIQVRPAAGRDVEADVARAVSIARRAAGVADVSPYSAEESLRMLEPWLGSGLGPSDLPVPRLIVVRLAENGRAELPVLRRAVAEAVPGASLDDHRAWFDRLDAMARTVVIGGLAIVFMMLLTAALSVVFATRAAVATNHPVVEVLHFVGARDAFIAGEFMRHFLWLGLKGGLVGGLGGLAVFVALGFAVPWFRATAGGDQLEALFGTFSLSATGYVGIAAIVALIAGVCAATSRWTVMRTLSAIN